MTTTLRLLTFTLLPTLGACVVYDDTCGKLDEDGRPLPGGEDEPGGDEPGEGFWLDPDVALPGEELIAGLHADQAFDWSQVVELHFYGPVRPCVFEARADELLITLLVDADAEPGAVDLLLELDDGGAIWVDDALTVLADGEEPVDETPASPCD